MEIDLFQGHHYEIIHNGIDLSLYTRMKMYRAEKSRKRSWDFPQMTFGYREYGTSRKQKSNSYLRIDIVSWLNYAKGDQMQIRWIVGAGSVAKKVRETNNSIGPSKNGLAG